MIFNFFSVSLDTSKGQFSLLGFHLKTCIFYFLTLSTPNTITLPGAGGMGLGD